MGKSQDFQRIVDGFTKTIKEKEQRIEELEGEKESWGRASGKLQVERDEARAKNKRLRDAIGKISLYCSDLDIDDYDNPYEVRITIEAIQSEIKALKEGE